MKGEINLTFDQLLSPVRQLPSKQKIKLSSELEKEFVNSKLSKLLAAFKNEGLDTKIIDEETELVRQRLL